MGLWIKGQPEGGSVGRWNGGLLLLQGGRAGMDQTGGSFTTKILTDEHCRGFTGACFGLYVHDLTGLGICADFDYFEIVG